jgi:hypothetical protein
LFFISNEKIYISLIEIVCSEILFEIIIYCLLRCKKIDPCDSCVENAKCMTGSVYGTENYCVCKDKYEGIGNKSCKKIPDPCDFCVENTDCVENKYGAKQCICKNGYDGNGLVSEIFF